MQCRSSLERLEDQEGTAGLASAECAEGTREFDNIRHSYFPHLPRFQHLPHFPTHTAPQPNARTLR